MPTSDNDDLELLAGEYALGVLDIAERRAVEARRLGDAALDAAIARWAARLAPLGVTTPPTARRRSLWTRVKQALPEIAAANIVETFHRGARRWNIAALSGGVLAACLAFALGRSETQRFAAPQDFVTVFQRDADSPAVMLAVDLASRDPSVRRIDAVAPAGKSYELWLINNHIGAPKSLGVIDKADFTHDGRLRAYAPEVVRTSLFAITVEQAGGSPTGKPTGAPIFAGKLAQVQP